MTRRTGDELRQVRRLLVPVFALIGVLIFAMTVSAGLRPFSAATPTVRIHTHPAAATTSRTASFTFTANVAKASFRCSLDGRAYRACTTPKLFRQIAFGKHRFTVTATSKGRTSSPARYAWTVKLPPDVPPVPNPTPPAPTPSPTPTPTPEPGGGGGGSTTPTDTTPVMSSLPSITGSAHQGQTLSADPGGWTNSPTSYGYQWLRGGSTVVGATGSTYLLVAADVAATVQVTVTATNDGGSATATSAATATVLPLPPSNTSLPAITGTAQQGQTLSAAPGGWTNSPSSYAYRWLRSGSTVVDETGSAYLLSAADMGATLQVTITATNDGGSATATSAATGFVLPLAPENDSLPTITHTAQQGQTLSADPGGWTNSPTSYGYQWLRDGATISGASGSTYLLVAADVGATLRVTVTASNDGGSATATSAATGVVLPLAPANSSLPTISGTETIEQATHASNGAWQNSPTGFSYEWQRSADGTTGWTDISGATGSDYLLADGDYGFFLRVTVTATNAGGSSAASSAATGPIAGLAPSNNSAPTLSGTAQDEQALTVSDGTWNGIPAPTLSYSWQLCNAAGTGCVATDAMGADYSLSAAEVGHTLMATVNAHNTYGTVSASALSGVVAVAGTASLTTAFGTANSNLTFTAAFPGLTGNAITVSYQPANVLTPSVSVSGNAISVSYRDQTLGLIPGNVGNGSIHVASFSPDSSQFCYTAVYNVTQGTSHLWRRDIWGDPPVQLTSAPGEDTSSCSWSPDGSTIAYVEQSLGVVKTIPASGGTPTTVPISGPGLYWISTRVAYSPDGSKFAFCGMYSGGVSNHNIWVAPSAGGIATRISDETDGGADLPNWSPDGQTITYVNDNRADNGSIVKTVPATGGTATLIMANATRPAFSTDGTTISYSSLSAGGIYNIPAGGGTPTLFIPTSDTGAYPAWSPDGKLVAYSTYSGGAFQMDLIGWNGATRLVSTAGEAAAAINASAAASALISVASAPGDNGTGALTTMAATHLNGG